jgi:polyisoprenoid-binding protein YceI
MLRHYDIDPNHSRVGFAVKHMMVATVTGEFARFSGYVDIDEDDPKTGRIEATIDAASIDTRVVDRDNHLRSADFFQVDKYPEIRFVSTGVERTDVDEYLVKGLLTIRNQTRPVTFQVDVEGRINDPYGNERVAASAKGELNRKDFGLVWNAPLEAGGVVVSDKVKIQMEMTVLRKLEVGAHAA